MSAVPTYAELLARTDAPPGSSWGVFGPGDQLGTLGFLTPERTADAARLVRRGAVFNLDYALDAFVPPPTGRGTPVHHVFAANANHRDDYIDNFYLQGTTQIDGLRHMRDPHHGFYGGVPDDRVGAGLPDLGIQLMAERGIAGRGVLLDVARYREAAGRPLSTDHMITIADLEATAAVERLTLAPGDVVLLRTGWAGAFLALTPEQRGAWTNFSAQPCPGLSQSKEMIAWIWDHGVSLLASDNVAVEAVPINPDSGLVLADTPPEDDGGQHNGLMHRQWIALLGLVLGELWHLDALADDCAADGVYEFLLTAKPLDMVGGVGSPANAMAVK